MFALIPPLTHYDLNQTCKIVLNLPLTSYDLSECFKAPKNVFQKVSEIPLLPGLGGVGGRQSVQ